MTRTNVIEWLSSILTGLIVGLIVFLAGGPFWASYGFGYVVFVIFRVYDKLKVSR